MIKGLIFDLDGVITETANLHYQAWKDTVKTLGINFTKKLNIKLKGLARIETLEKILEAHQVFHLTQVEKIKIANAKNDLYLAKLKNSLGPNNILPKITNFIKEAKKANLKLAIASSSHNAPFILKKIGLFKYFDFIVNPKNIKNSKPAPDIYLAACQGLNLLPTDCIGFEDAIAGIYGLLAAKIKTVAITHNDPGNWEVADLVIKNTSELNLSFLLTKFNH